MIHAVIEGPNLNKEDVYNLLKEKGYTIIKVLKGEYGPKDRRMLGFQDHDVHVTDGGKTTVIPRDIKNGGRIQFEKDKLGILVAYVIKTEYNMKVLAANQELEHISIADEKIREEVKQLWNRMWASMSDHEKKNFERTKTGSRKEAIEFDKPITENDLLAQRLHELEREKEELQKKADNATEAKEAYKAVSEPPKTKTPEEIRKEIREELPWDESKEDKRLSYLPYPDLIKEAKLLKLDYSDNRSAKAIKSKILQYKRAEAYRKKEKEAVK